MCLLQKTIYILEKCQVQVRISVSALPPYWYILTDPFLFVYAEGDTFANKNGTFLTYKLSSISVHLLLFFFENYLFIFGCVGSSLLRAGFL